MDILSVNFSSSEHTEDSAVEYHNDRLAMFESTLKPLLESFDNITFFKKVTTSDLQTVYRFKIEGFENILLSFWFESPNSTSSLTSYSVGISKLENEDIWDYTSSLRVGSYPIEETHKSRSDKDSEGNTIYYYWSEIVFYQRYIKNPDNILNVWYLGLRDNGYNLQSILFDFDNKNRAVAVFLYSVNEIYPFYDDDSSFTRCLLPENVAISFSSDNECLLENIVLTLSDMFQGYLTNLIKIYNNSWNANNNNTTTGTLIDIDGVRYRQICNRFFVKDYN